MIVAKILDLFWLYIIIISFISLKKITKLRYNVLESDTISLKSKPKLLDCTSSHDFEPKTSQLC